MYSTTIPNFEEPLLFDTTQVENQEINSSGTSDLRTTKKQRHCLSCRTLRRRQGIASSIMWMDK
jgi:hypothetical protein